MHRDEELRRSSLGRGPFLPPRTEQEGDSKSNWDVKSIKVVGLSPEREGRMYSSWRVAVAGQNTGWRMWRRLGTDLEANATESKLGLDKGLPRSPESQEHTFVGEPSFWLCNFLFFFPQRTRPKI